MTLGELYEALKELEEVETRRLQNRLWDDPDELDKRRDELRAQQLKVFSGAFFQGNVHLS